MTYNDLSHTVNAKPFVPSYARAIVPYVFKEPRERLCYFFHHNRCLNGDACPFIHDERLLTPHGQAFMRYVNRQGKKKTRDASRFRYYMDTGALIVLRRGDGGTDQRNMGTKMQYYHHYFGTPSRRDQNNTVIIDDGPV